MYDKFTAIYAKRIEVAHEERDMMREAEEEEKRRAEEEARKKAEAEARRIAEEEAQRIAEAEAKQVEEEARRKAAIEAAVKRAEEEHARREAEVRDREEMADVVHAVRKGFAGRSLTEIEHRIQEMTKAAKEQQCHMEEHERDKREDQRKGEGKQKETTGLPPPKQCPGVVTLDINNVSGVTLPEEERCMPCSKGKGWLCKVNNEREPWTKCNTCLARKVRCSWGVKEGARKQKRMEDEVVDSEADENVAGPSTKKVRIEPVRGVGSESVWGVSLEIVQVLREILELSREREEIVRGTQEVLVETAKGILHLATAMERQVGLRYNWETNTHIVVSDDESEEGSDDSSEKKNKGKGKAKYVFRDETLQ
ncbi:hypothetical protein Clacol_006048 [Clathrus columnatus]|uniref:Zn(2)-C6 fungal-type domain-containing protein n=1 Tax=Clathrus columnatus TaxID=1419009 RepID=A0AAV5AFY4_9AGAM|nr:hypothetical protein Clacol_006048 [Clathrus columnatus]